MDILIIRTTIIYLLIIAAMRLMGKKQLGELQPSELVSTILISNLASISIESPELPLISSVVPVFLIVSIEIIISVISLYCPRIEKLVSGSPRVVIKNGILDQKMLRELRLTPCDLMEALRSKDIFDISEVNYAVVEPNGSMSIFKNFESDTVKAKDLQLKPDKIYGPCIAIVVNGYVDKENLAYFNKDDKWLKSKLLAQNCTVSDLVLFTLDKSGKTTIIKKQ